MDSRYLSLHVLLLAGAAVCAGWLLGGCARPLPPLAGKAADWAAFNYQKIGAALPKHFDARFVARQADGDYAPCGRLALNVQDPSNYYFVQMEGSEIGIGRVENGIEVHIGSRGRAGIGSRDPHKIVVKRRSASIVVVLDGTVVASAYDDTFSGGEAHLGATDKSLAYEKPAIQKVDEPYFADDFMKAEGEMGDWQTVSGAWEVSRIENPSLSSNAFCLIKKADDTEGKIVVSPFDHWFWDNYLFSVAVRPLGDKPVGVFFYYRDEDNWFLFKWGARGSKSAKVQLVKRFRGKETVLAEKEGGFTKDQWYQVKIEVVGTQASASVDDCAVCDVEDANLCFGTIGLYAGGGEARFDDAVVKASRTFREDFKEYSAGKWTELGGAWNVVTESNGVNSFTVNTEGGAAKAVSGEADWRNYTCTARIGPWAKETAGICFYYQDEQNYYAFRWQKTPRPERSLVKVVDGKETVLRRDVPPEGGAGRYEVCVAVEDGHILLSVDGAPVFEDWDTDLDGGKIGLCASGTPSAMFGDIVVRFPSERSAMPTITESFSRETTMSDWASVKSDWDDPRNDMVANQVTQTHWCRADFPGDADIEIRHLPKLVPGASLRMLLGGDGKDLVSAYALVVSADKPGKCELWRQSAVVATGEMDTAGEIQGLRFRRAGQYVAALLDNRLIAKYRDEKPLDGRKVGYSVNKLDVAKQEVEVFCNNIYNYSFRESIYDWRVAAGIWEVTNRWQCDPRWSFFSGRSNRLAAIWNKKEMKGDVTVEFFAGIKMDQERGRKYEYASDMNITICADGNDLTSGYSFIFGGWQNTRTRIVKGTKVLGEKFERIPADSGIHRRWFYLKAMRRGNHLAFYIDNELILECDDPAPLEGGRVAIWTYNNGIMISRVRISNASGEKKESPFAAHPEECKCVYDSRS